MKASHTTCDVNGVAKRAWRTLHYHAELPAGTRLYGLRRCGDRDTFECTVRVPEGGRIVAIHEDNIEFDPAPVGQREEP